MTISSTTRTAGPFTGTGLVSTFSFSFKVFQASDLLVVRQTISTGSQTTFILNTDYTVSLNVDQDSNPGGSITLVAGALASTYTLVITSSIANLQPTILTNQGGFYPEVINDSLDRATIQIQQVATKSGRELSAPLVDGAIDMVLPSALNRASKFLYFGASGEPMAAAGTNTGNNTSPGNLTLTANNGNSGSARDVIFYDYNTETMRILGSGATSKVGIGTSSPTKKLEVATSSNSLQIVSAARNANIGTGVAAIGFNVSDTSEAHSTKAGIGLLRTSPNGVGTLCFYNNANSGGSGDFTTSDERMRIESGGNVVIGNVTAAGNTNRALDIYNHATGASASSGLRLITHDTTGAPSSIGQLIKYQTGGFSIHNTDTNAAAHMNFSVGSSERMRITSAGLVGIGTPSPAYLLTLSGGSGLSGFATDGTVGQAFAYASSTLAYAGTTSGHPYALITGNTEKMRILSAGQVCIGIGTLLSNTNRVNVAYTGAGAEYGIGLRPLTSGTSTAMSFENSSSSQVGRIDVTASVTSYVTSSDYRLKTNVVPMTSALDKIDALNPCKYTWIADASDGEGFIAHELQSVIPHAVTGTKDDVDENGNIRPQGVDYSRVVPTLTAAIKELKAIVEAQAARIAALEARA